MITLIMAQRVLPFELLYILGAILFILPLEAHVISCTARLLCNFWTALVALILLLVYGYGFFTGQLRLHGRSIAAAVALTSVLILAVQIRAYFELNFAEVFRLLTLIWLLPLLERMISQTGSRIALIFILGIMALHAQWAIAQFAIQHDLGFQVLGESLIAVDIDGVAKFTSDGGKLIRGYGPYPHSNSLGGSLVIGFIILLLSIRTKLTKIGPLFIFFILVLGIFFSFSRAAYLALGLIVSMRLLQRHPQRPRAFMRLAGILIVILFTMFPLVTLRFVDPEDAAAHERLQGLSWAIGISHAHSVLRGLGPGNYTSVLHDYLDNSAISYQSWQVAPVHNSLLLFLIEWGLISAILAILIITWWMWHPRNNRINQILYLTALSPMVLLDHYLVTQSAPLIWAILGFIIIQAGQPGFE